MLFKRLRKQAKAFVDFKEQLEFLKHNAIDSSEVLQRVGSVEGSVRELTESKLSPFRQVEILERLERMEEEGARALAERREASEEAHRSQSPRLDRLENQLLGVSNLPGRMAAVDDMAEQLGVEVPYLELSDSNVPPDWECRPNTTSRGKGGKLATLELSLEKVQRDNEKLRR
eukprot:evm.model.scf_131.4 EVM.evm.TU.scf_131.4   scf_131:27010-29860(-)